MKKTFGSVPIRMERGCVADQPQHFECAAADASRTAALRENFKLGRFQTFSALKFICALLAALATASFATAQIPKAAHTFAIGTNDFLLDGARFQIRCGEVHSARVPAEYWRHRLQMAKAMGLNTVCAYLFWNLHEPRQGEFNWSDQANVAEFCRIAQEEGLWVILRPGPYACAEWEMGEE
jgi:hypothetical protein